MEISTTELRTNSEETKQGIDSFHEDEDVELYDGRPSRLITYYIWRKAVLFPTAFAWPWSVFIGIALILALERCEFDDVKKVQEDVPRLSSTDD